MISSMLIAILETTMRDGGATFSPVHGDMKGRPFFAVAFDPDRAIPVKGKCPSLQQLEAFVAGIQALMDDKPNLCIGTWYDSTSDQTLLDVVELVADEGEAVRLAKERTQDAIYDLERGETIYTNIVARDSSHAGHNRGQQE